MEEFEASLGGSVRRLLCSSSSAIRTCNYRMISISSGLASCCSSWRVMTAAPGAMDAARVASTTQDSRGPEKFRPLDIFAGGV